MSIFPSSARSFFCLYYTDNLSLVNLFPKQKRGFSVRIEKNRLSFVEYAHYVFIFYIFLLSYHFIRLLGRPSAYAPRSAAGSARSDLRKAPGFFCPIPEKTGKTAAILPLRRAENRLPAAGEQARRAGNPGTLCAVPASLPRVAWLKVSAQKSSVCIKMRGFPGIHGSAHRENACRTPIKNRPARTRRKESLDLCPNFKYA